VRSRRAHRHQSGVPGKPPTPDYDRVARERRRPFGKRPRHHRAFSSTRGWPTSHDDYEERPGVNSRSLRRSPRSRASAASAKTAPAATGPNVTRWPPPTITNQRSYSCAISPGSWDATRPQALGAKKNDWDRRCTWWPCVLLTVQTPTCISPAVQPSAGGRGPRRGGRRRWPCRSSGRSRTCRESSACAR
jgi:hypothetical protein